MNSRTHENPTQSQTSGLLPGLLLIAIAFLVLVSPTTLPKAHAATITLWGRVIAPNGWGLASNSVTNPGPTIVTTPGGTVSLSLLSGDSITHQFCVDYEITPDLVCQNPVEPQSSTFSSSTTAKPFSFTATQTPGNYTYYCSIHLDAMIGTLVVKAPHDVAVTSLTVTRAFSNKGVILTNPIHVSVTAQNPGNNTETFFVYARANTTLIGNTTITLARGATGTVTFGWNTTQSLARGTYLLSANATKVTGESYFANNQVLGPNFLEKIKGDVNGDCKVDIVDLATVGSTFGASSGGTGFNPAADLNNDLTINIVDLVLVAGSFGQIC